MESGRDGDSTGYRQPEIDGLKKTSIMTWRPILEVLKRMSLPARRIGSVAETQIGTRFGDGGDDHHDASTTTTGMHHRASSYDDVAHVSSSENGIISVPVPYQQEEQDSSPDAAAPMMTKDYDYEEDYEEEEEEEEVAYPSRTVKLLMAGGLAGVVSRTATAPLDRLKMLLQVNDAAKQMTIKEGLKQMAGEGSLKAFFKGNGTNVIKIAPETAIKLTTNDIYKRMIASDPEEITPPQRMVAGALAGSTAQVIIYPLELVKTRLAVCPPGTYAGILDCARKVLRQEGWRSFYRGLMPSMMGIVPYAGVDITVFELLKEQLLDEYDGVPPPHLILGAGMLSSSLAQFSAYPLALVRTRLQAQGVGGREAKYTGMTDVLCKTYQKEGIRGLYKGSLTNLAKLAPAAGISWFVFEETKVLLGLSMRS